MEISTVVDTLINQNKQVFINYRHLLTTEEVGLLLTSGVGEIYYEDFKRFEKILYTGCSLPESSYIKDFTYANFELDGQTFFICLKFTDKSAENEYTELVEYEDLINPEKRKIRIMIGYADED